MSTMPVWKLVVIFHLRTLALHSAVSVCECECFVALKWEGRSVIVTRAWIRISGARRLRI